MSDQSPQFDQVEWQQVGEFARQKLIQLEDKRIRMLELSAGFREAEWCDRGHIGYVISGELQMEFPESNASYSEGDGLFLLPGQKHKASISQGTTQLFLVDQDLD